MSKRILLILIATAFLAACNSAGEPDSSPGAILIANPPSPVPVPTNEMVKEYLSKNQIFKSSSSDELGKTYIFEFDVVKKTVTVTAGNKTNQTEIAFDIKEDGTIITTDENAVYDIGGGYNKDSTKYPVLVDITGKDIPIAKALASTNNDINYQLKILNLDELIFNEPNLIIDSDADLSKEGSYYVKGTVFAKSLKFDDFCLEEGRVLGEFAVEDNDVSRRDIECNCHYGKCIDELTDTERTAINIAHGCTKSEANCSFMQPHAAMKAKPTLNFFNKTDKLHQDSINNYIYNIFLK